MIDISKMTIEELENLAYVCNEELADRKTNEKKKAIENFRQALDTLSKYNIEVYFDDGSGYEQYIPDFENLSFDY